MVRKLAKISRVQPDEKPLACASNICWAFGATRHWPISTRKIARNTPEQAATRRQRCAEGSESCRRQYIIGIEHTDRYKQFQKLPYRKHDQPRTGGLPGQKPHGCLLVLWAGTAMDLIAISLPVELAGSGSAIIGPSIVTSRGLFFLGSKPVRELQPSLTCAGCRAPKVDGWTSIAGLSTAQRRMRSKPKSASRRRGSVARRWHTFEFGEGKSTIRPGSSFIGVETGLPRSKRDGRGHGNLRCSTGALRLTLCDTRGLHGSCRPKSVITKLAETSECHREHSNPGTVITIRIGKKKPQKYRVSFRFHSETVSFRTSASAKSLKNWSGRGDSNARPQPWQGCSSAAKSQNTGLSFQKIAFERNKTHLFHSGFIPAAGKVRPMSRSANELPMRCIACGETWTLALLSTRWSWGFVEQMFSLECPHCQAGMDFQHFQEPGKEHQMR